MAVASGKYLTFALETQTYGMPILCVKEIIGMTDITPLPGMPAAVRGVINLRGNIIPVVDLRLKFGMPERDYDDRTCIVVVESGRKEGAGALQTTGGPLSGRDGLIVDKVSEVLDIPQDSIEEPPRFRGTPAEWYLMGLGKVRDKVVMLLEVERILDREERQMLAGETVVVVN